tara:strand:+ start:342 stop:761 length:420 start_codon:yes stop_codon:yes gene_type:complete
MYNYKKSNIVEKRSGVSKCKGGMSMTANLKDKRVDGRLANQNELSEMFYINERYADFAPPVEIDLSEIFDRVVRIKTLTAMKTGEFIGVDIRVSRVIYSVVGRVELVEADEMGYWVTLFVDYVPNGMLLELEDVMTSSI